MSNPEDERFLQEETGQAPLPPDERRSATHPALVLTVLATASFIAVLDVWITNVGLPAIGKGVGDASLSSLSWILTAYAIIYAAFLVPAGRLADRYGRKGGFLIGLGVFSAASLGAALSSDVWILVGFRCIQAAGAAALTPTSLGLVLTSAPPDRVAKYVKIWFTTGALSASAGPPIGGLLVEISWRWLFLVNLPIGLAAFAAAARYVPDAKHETDGEVPDLLGGLLLVGSIGAIALGIVQGPEWGWSSTEVIAAFVAGILALGGFVARSMRSRAPIIRFELLRDRVFASGNGTTFMVFAAFSIELLSVTLWMQDHWGWSAIRTGLAMAPGPAVVPIFATVADGLIQKGKVSVGRIAALGIGLIALGAVLFAVQIDESPNYLSGFLPFWLIVGTGMGLSMPAVISSSTVDLPAEETATGSAIVQMSQQIGSVVGISVLVAALGVASGAAGIDLFQSAWVVAAAIAVAAMFVALGVSPRKEKTAEPESLATGSA